MGQINSQMHIFDSWKIEITQQDLAGKIRTSRNRERILKEAKDALLQIRGIWSPRAVIHWGVVENVTEKEVVLRSLNGDKIICLTLGFASRFMVAAKQALVGVYTAGDELEREAVRVSLQKRPMDSYFYDLIGLIILEKVGARITRIVEEKAAAMSWGVGPFLSPGSVHGWELSDQSQLCSFVPLEKIGVEKHENGVLKPFKTLSCLIGIGADYEAEAVGTPCKVCSKNQQCELRWYDI